MSELAVCRRKFSSVHWDDWTQAEARRFDFPYHSARSNLKLTTTFHPQCWSQTIAGEGQTEKF
jgi:hypothetical protein